MKELAERIIAENPMRFTKKEKEAFLRTAQEYLTENGVNAEDIKRPKMGANRNLVIGDPAAPYVFTAHYDTPGRTGWLFFTSPLLGQTGANIFFVVAFCVFYFAVGWLAASWMSELDGAMNIIAFVLTLYLPLLVLLVPMVVKNKSNMIDNTSGAMSVLYMAAKAMNDPELRGKCCFVLFDNEEWGLFGSLAYALWLKKNKISPNAGIYVNIDCVGGGDTLLFSKTPGRNVGIDVIIDRLSKQGVKAEKKTSAIVFMSDHANFRNSMMVSHVKRSALGFCYLPKIHTGRDKEVDIAQLEELCGALLKTAE